jgi:hypothetical protein
MGELARLLDQSACTLAIAIEEVLSGAHVDVDRGQIVSEHVVDLAREARPLAHRGELRDRAGPALAPHSRRPTIARAARSDRARRVGARACC